MTQPPLSRQIQKLEREVGVRLLERSNRWVALTTAGEAFLGEARRVLDLAEAAPATARRAAAGTAGSLSIGFTATGALSVLPTILREADTHLPDVAVELNELVSTAQFQALGNGELDLGLVRLPPDSAEFASRLIFREPLIAAVPSDHPLGASGDPLSSLDLAGTDMIMYSESGASYFAELVSSVLVNIRPRSVQRVVQVHSMLALVGAGRGAALVPASASRFHFDGVRFRPLRDWSRAVVELRVAWRADSRNPTLHRALDQFSSLSEIDHDAV
jgi:DNA-binding transcriptional LysR family regulator